MTTYIDQTNAALAKRIEALETALAAKSAPTMSLPVVDKDGNVMRTLTERWDDLPYGMRQIISRIRELERNADLNSVLRVLLRHLSLEAVVNAEEFGSPVQIRKLKKAKP